jgi:hypothetical protein
MRESCRDVERESVGQDVHDRGDFADDAAVGLPPTASMALSRCLFRKTLAKF